MDDELRDLLADASDPPPATFRLEDLVATEDRRRTRRHLGAGLAVAALVALITLGAATLAYRPHHISVPVAAAPSPVASPKPTMTVVPTPTEPTDAAVKRLYGDIVKAVSTAAPSARLFSTSGLPFLPKPMTPGSYLSAGMLKGDHGTSSLAIEIAPATAVTCVSVCTRRADGSIVSATTPSASPSASPMEYRVTVVRPDGTQVTLTEQDAYLVSPPATGQLQPPVIAPRGLVDIAMGITLFPVGPDGFEPSGAPDAHPSG